MTERTYQTDAIAVHWDSSRCIHSGICLQTLPAVFDLDTRPWVTVDGADTATVAAAIDRCPSGALRYERLDGQPGEQPSTPATVVPWPNGPLVVRGDVEVQLRHGDRVTREYRMALCRCGHSKNQPFCDVSHRDAEFRDTDPAIRAGRLQAETPGDIAAPETPPTE
jgi:uncharacterized Fe-S cluster protein YjdI/CDGSH-type Zn-finger protein